MKTRTADAVKTEGELAHVEQPATSASRGSNSAMPVRAASVASTARADQAPVDGDVDMESAACSAPTPSAMQALGSQSRQLIKVIQKLDALGINSTLPSLPKIVVVGDQSAGKSSIIEATCAITLPRSEGTCTRCPFQITTTAAKDANLWSAEVSLTFKYDYDPMIKASNSGESYDCWVEREHPWSFKFTTVDSKENLEMILRRAQLAILNPRMDPSYFVNQPIPQQLHLSHGVGFSPNIVSLLITGPDLPELSLFDLPGAFNITAETSDDYLVGTIETLLSNYIKDEKALVLLACAGNQDVETSRTFSFVHKHSARDRCIGVLTKPDLLPCVPEKLEQISKMLHKDAKLFKIEHGWYVTRQLSQQEIDTEMSYDAARAYEASFFSHNEPWNSSLSGYTSRFGIPNLQKALSELLTTHIRNDLPEIEGRVNYRLAVIEKELAAFPKQVNGACLTVLTETNAFSNYIKEQFNADSSTSSFRPEYKKVFRGLRTQLQESRPKVCLSTPGHQKPVHSVDDSSSPAEDQEQTPSKKQKTNSGRARDGARIGATPGPSPASRTPASTRKRAVPQIAQKSQAAPAIVKFRLDDVKAKFDAAPGFDMPGVASAEVVRQLTLEPLSGLVTIYSATLEKINNLMVESLQHCVEQVFGRQRRSQLVREAGRIVQELLQQLIQQVTEDISKVVQGNTVRPMTYFSTRFSDMKAAKLKALCDERTSLRVREHFENLESQNYQKIPSAADIAKHKSDIDWLKRYDFPTDDPYKLVVESLAQVLAYYDLLTEQMVDVVARFCELHLMENFQNRVGDTLLGGLQVTELAYCDQLLAEDPAREAQRSRLIEEKGKLEQALVQLHQLRSDV